MLSSLSFSKKQTWRRKLLAKVRVNRMAFLCERVTYPIWGPSWPGTHRSGANTLVSWKGRTIRSHVAYLRAFFLAPVWSHFPWQHPHRRAYHSSLEVITCSQPLASSCLSLHAITLCQINFLTRELCTCPPSALMPAIDPFVAPHKIRLILLNQSSWHILIFSFLIVLSKGSVQI